MLAGAKWFLQSLGTVPPDLQQPVGKFSLVPSLHPLKPFTNRLGDSFGQTFSSKPGQLPGQLVGIFVFDVHAHGGIFYLLYIPFYHTEN